MSSCHFGSKRRLTTDDPDEVFNRFFNEFTGYNSFMKTFQTLLSGAENVIVPSVISSCDADYSTCYGGLPFHECECIANADVGHFFHFGTFFINGAKIFDSLKNKRVPENKIYSNVASRLLHYVLDETDWHDELKKLRDNNYLEGETQVMVTLAEHLFNRLTIEKGYLIDKHASKAGICRCGKCERDSLNFDDTSIGNKKVWHGSVDVLFDRCDVTINCTTAENQDNEDESPGGHYCNEIKKNENLDNIQVRNQIIAQTIVFSLLQKQRHPSLKHFLTPSILTNANQLKFFFYDAENDVLLESNKYDIVYEKTFNLPASMSYETVIAVWLVLNHRILCTGPFPEYIENAPKSLFKHFARDSLEIYEHDLKFQGRLKRELPGQAFVNWSTIVKRNPGAFVWPASLHQPNFD